MEMDIKVKMWKRHEMQMKGCLDIDKDIGESHLRVKRKKEISQCLSGEKSYGRQNHGIEIFV